MTRACVLLLLLATLSACTSVGRQFSRNLPAWLRAESGRKEKEVLRELLDAREPEQADLEEQDRRFAEIEAALQREDWEEAGDLCGDYLELFATSRHDERIRYEQGRAWYNEGNYNRAYTAFRSFTDVYVISDYYPDVMEMSYRMGELYISGRRNSFFGIFSSEGRGERYLNFVVERFPSGPRAPDAQWLVARWLEGREIWERAQLAYAFLAQTWPDSRWAEESAFRAAECSRARIKGANYDPERMVAAREAYESYLREHPEGAFAAEAVAGRDAVAALEGEKLLQIGKWYLGRGKTFASRYYFQRVRVLHGNTPAAEEAAQLLQRTQAEGSELPPVEEPPPSGGEGDGA